MRVIVNVLFVFVLITGLSGCSNDDVKVVEWDNSKYESFMSSVGIDVFNDNSFDHEPHEKDAIYKTNNTLYITDLSKPITVKFNNNGKNRNFIMNVYYDYKPLRFKIGNKGDYEQLYKFDLDDGHEIELPLYLPVDLNMVGAHKLLVTFSIGHDSHAKELKQVIEWYGASTIQDIVFESNTQQVLFDQEISFDEPTNEVNMQYDYTLNQDYDYTILDSGVLPSPPISLTVKPKQEFKLNYNVAYSGENDGQVLLITTIGYKATSINNQPYLTLKVPKGKSVVGEATIQAPEEPGLYEIISYSISSPFDKINSQNLRNHTIQASPRFTLEVRE